MPMDSLTDLIGGVLLLPAWGIVFRLPTERNAEKRVWLRFFALLAASCITGFVTHFVCEPRSALAFRIAWILLYPLLYQTAVCFLLLAMQIRSEDGGISARYKRLLQIVSAVCVFASLLLLWVLKETDLDIRLFCLFAIVTVVAGYVLLFPKAFFDRDAGAKILFAALLPLLPAAFFQVKRDVVWNLLWEFNSNAITHLFVITAEIILFVAACVRLRKRP